MYRSLSRWADGFNRSTLPTGLGYANSFVDTAQRVGDVSDAVSGGSGLFGRLGGAARGVGGGVAKLAGGVGMGASLGSLAGPVGTAVGAGLGGLFSLPSAVGSIWDAVKSLRGGGGQSNPTPAPVDVPRDLQMLDTELLYDEARSRGRGPLVPRRRATPGYIPEDAMYISGAFDRVPVASSSGYYPRSYQDQLRSYSGPDYRIVRDVLGNAAASSSRPYDMYRYASRFYQ